MSPAPLRAYRPLKCTERHFGRTPQWITLGLFDADTTWTMAVDTRFMTITLWVFVTRAATTRDGHARRNPDFVKRYLSLLDVDGQSLEAHGQLLTRGDQQWQCFEKVLGDS